MVLGLDRGGACEGIAYRVAAANAAETTRYLRAREQVNGVYREAHVPVQLITGAASRGAGARPTSSSAPTPTTPASCRSPCRRA